MTKFVYHCTSRYDWPLIANEGLIPQEPIWEEDWPQFDTREPMIYGTRKLSIAKGHDADGVVLRMLDDGKWNVVITETNYRRVLWRTTPIPPDQIKALLPNGKWCPLSKFEMSNT